MVLQPRDKTQLSCALRGIKQQVLCSSQNKILFDFFVRLIFSTTIVQLILTWQ